MDATSYFKGKKITIMGLGLLGRGVGDTAYLAKCGAELIVTDLKSAEQLAESIEQLKEFSNIQFVFGEHRHEDFKDRDFILKAAGVPIGSPYIETARDAGTPIKMSASWFAEIARVPVIGVTGTRGKSTTTHMLHSILDHAGKKVLLGGNVRGVSTLSLLEQVTPEHLALFELDSWQLQGFGESRMSPHISIFTTFFPDHLNYYHNDLDAYLADKANIFLFQKPEDTLVLGSQCAGIIQEKYGAYLESSGAWKSIVSGDALPNEWKLKIPGAHNRYDAALALTAARSLEISDAVSQEALESFGGVEGRLQYVRDLDGVAIYNDNNATTPDATLAALEALSEEYAGKILLIMGGADKGIDMNALLAAIPDTTKRVALLVGSGTDRIRENLPTAEMYEALGDLRMHAEPGDVILFSPAFASFGLFTNEYDRNDQFVTMVQSYE
jgi:UDP-N-acetylmuramoylalanine--D-glutamate ligase